jgi:hypothetical protein
MTHQTKALCQGSMLTAQFNAANPPLIWRFDLERNHSFTLALQGESGDWDLGVTSPKGDFYSVVHFAAREDAEEALDAVGKALACRQRRCGVIGKTLLSVVLAALVITVSVVGYGFYVKARPQSTAVSSAPGVVAPAPATAIQEGVPLSADDVLKPPQ